MRVLLAYALVTLVSFQQVPPPRPPVGTGPGSGGQGGVGRGGGTTQRPPARPLNSRTRSATADALDRYVAGDYEKALTTLQRLGGFEMTHAEEWILSGGAPAIQKRRFIAALVALDYTASRPGLSPLLYEWGAKTLRESPEPQPFEQTWLRASIALAEGRGTWKLLTGIPATLGARPVLPVGVDPLLGTGHLAYALSRFPDDARFKLARIVAVEAETSPPSAAITVATTGKAIVNDGIDAQVLSLEGPGGAGPATKLELAAEALNELVADADVGPEARLRRGYLQLRLGRRDRAREEFSRIDTTDRFVSYLAHMFTGWSLAEDGQVDPAIAAYRRALGVVPHARSTSTLLAAFCVMSGRLDEAESVANELMQKPAVGPDPWRTYLLGDYRDYDALMTRMREAVK
jgi:tetratricopeptide (TPR) repeat protein